jgi:Leucine-rich repeat (LRR) protein
LTGSIPTQIGNMRSLSVLDLQYNQLTGAIPASLGDLQMLTRLDLSFNYFFGSIPVWLVNAPILEVLNIQNNSLRHGPFRLYYLATVLICSRALSIDVFGESRWSKVLILILWPCG